MKFQLTIRGIVFSALFAALIVVFGFVNINLGFTPVPITLATMAVMLAGALLGAAYGFFSVFLVIALSALGLPLLAGTGGLAVILGPNGGYLWSWPFSALFIGLFLFRIKGNSARSYILTFITLEVFGSFIMYITGVPWLAHVLKTSLAKALILGCYPYLPGDALKAIITTVIVVPIRQMYPISRLLGNHSTHVIKLD